MIVIQKKCLVVMKWSQKRKKRNLNLKWSQNLGGKTKVLKTCNHDLHFISLGYTRPILSSCIECHETFRTYVPGTDCLLPDNTVVCLQEPTEKCPNCSGGSWLCINEDLFPHLVSK